MLIPKEISSLTFSFPSIHKQLIGNRGKKSQSTMHAVHQKTGMMFFAEINKNAVSCWNSKTVLRPSNMIQVAHDNEKLIYPADLDVSQ